MRQHKDFHLYFTYYAFTALLLAVWIVGCQGTESPQVAPPDPLAMSPEEVVEGFYNWYTEFPGSPLADRGYAESIYLSSDMVAKLDEMVQAFEGGGGGYDPILCAQDRPNEIFVLEATVNGNTAVVPVESSFQGHSLTVDLVLQDGEWKIHGTSCMSR